MEGYIYLDYTTFIAKVVAELIPLDEVPKGSEGYTLIAIKGGQFKYWSWAEGADKTDYEANYQALANKALELRDSEGHIIQRSSNVNTDDFFRVRHKGIMDATIPKGTSLDIDWTIEQLQWQGSNKPSVMIGVEYKVVGGNDGDTLDFSVLDRDGIIYPANTVLDEFADGFKVFPDVRVEIREHQATLVPGLVIRCHYVNSDGTGNDARFICNLLRYMDTE